MAYVRKTKDEWQLFINYGEGFELVETRDTFKEIKEVSTSYRKNAPQYQRSIKMMKIKQNNA